MRRPIFVVVCVACVFALLNPVSSSSNITRDKFDFTRDAAGIPPGYAIDLYATIDWPAEIACADDRRCFIDSVHDPADENRSAIWVVYPDKNKQRIYRGPIYETQHLGEKGLTGLALHPRFAQDDRIFFYWAVPDRSNTFAPTTTVISSIRSDGSDYRELWRFESSIFADIHVAGGIVTVNENGHDYLYVSVGNFTQNAWSQDVTHNEGKIHRFEIAGDTLQIPTDNPFYNDAAAKKSIWARGFRNPFRFTRDTASGKFYITENGDRFCDRIYLLQKGGNYGWPVWNDCQQHPGYVQPIYTFFPTVGITDIEVYHGPIPGWGGKVFVCAFNNTPLYMFTIASDGSLIDRQSVAEDGQNCSIALGTRAGGALLYSRQSTIGQVLSVAPINPGPGLSAQLNSDANLVARGQRIHYRLDITNLSFAKQITATLNLPNELTYLPGSSFGGAIHDSSNHRIIWSPNINANRSLRAGFDAVSFAPAGTALTLTAHIVDQFGAAYNTNTSLNLTNTSPLNFQFIAQSPAIRSNTPATYHLLVRNRSISDTRFALTTTLPGTAQFIQNIITGTTTYDANLHRLLWQRPLNANRSAFAAVVISTTTSLNHQLTFTSTLSSASASSATFISHFMIDPSLRFLPVILKTADASSNISGHLITLDDDPFGRYGTPPGAPTQPLDSGTCQTCHNVAGSSIYAGWSTSAHGYSAIDPVFQAALHNASQQVQDVERWCTQCHQPENWLNGHPLTATDSVGITCAACHRAVDPISVSGIDQAAIQQAQAMNVLPPRAKQIGGNGALIVDPNDVRRGTNFLSGSAPHNVALSAYQGNSALCGSCHSVFAPHLAPDAISGEFTLDTPDLANENPFFLQSTYPEWLHSQYATNGIHCQNCHMPTVDGYVADVDKGGQPRSVPMHHIAGGNLFILDIFDQSDVLGDTTAQRNAIQAILSQAATITSSINANTISVGVTCRAGHKCPTGYEEGRAWILQVEQLDQNGQRVACSGCWDSGAQSIVGYAAQPGDPDYDPELTEFAVHFGISGTHALQLSQPATQGFNLALNNAVFSDTRIPPRGWDASAYAGLGITPTASYAPASCSAIVDYGLHPDARVVIVRLLHWSHTTPYLKFLRDNGGTAGQSLWNSWQATLALGNGQPTTIISTTLSIAAP